MENTNAVKISDYMKINDIFEVKSLKEDEWIPNSVKYIDDENDILEIKLLEIFLVTNLMVGDKIQFKLIKDNYVYIFDGQVVDIGLINSERIRIKVESVRKYDNERYSKRYTVNLCGRLIYNNQDSSAYVTVKNISDSGLSIVTNQRIFVGEEIDIDIVLWKERILSIEGKIVRMFRIEGIYKYGIVIENMTEESKRILSEFIEEIDLLQIQQLTQ